MANKNVCIFILIATIVAQATWVRATDYVVGEDKGWNEGVDFQAWADGKNFYPGDHLKMIYEYGKHNVVLVESKEAWDQCSKAGPHQELARCGHNTVICFGPGMYYVFSDVDNDCANGIKIMFEVKPYPGVKEGRNLILK